MGESKAHVVLVPSMGQGHLIPFMELAKLLASQQLSVSCMITAPESAERLQPQIQGSNLDIRLVSLPLPAIDGVPPGISSIDDVPRHVGAILFVSSYKLAGPFEQWLDEQMNNFNDNNSQEAPDSFPPPVCIISDIFRGWVQSSGAKFGIPTVVFHTTGAFARSVSHSLYTYKPHESVEGDEEYFEVPGLSFDLKLRKSDLPVMMRDPDSYPFSGFVRAELKQSIEGHGILINTFYELDSLGIDYLRNLTGRPVWSIGPIIPAAVFDDTGICRESMNSRGKAADIAEEECLKWLDSRSHQSVVFVCFGSRCSLNEKQIRAVAAGLEASGHAFIWAIRFSHTETKPKGTDVGLPEGFEERTRERGLLIWGWAPQLLILSHPSVGAFLSHCGWSSTLESVSLGIPMITWPMSAEQPFNSKFLVDCLGIGIQICSDMDSVPDEEDEEEVRRAVSMVLAEEEGEKMRKRAQELRKLAKIALGEAGSSFTNLKSFIQEMQQLEVARARHE